MAVNMENNENQDQQYRVLKETEELVEAGSDESTFDYEEWEEFDATKLSFSLSAAEAEKVSVNLKSPANISYHVRKNEEEIDIQTWYEPTENDFDDCVICIFRSANAVFYRCGHRSICWSCAKKYSRRKVSVLSVNLRQGT